MTRTNTISLKLLFICGFIALIAGAVDAQDTCKPKPKKCPSEEPVENVTTCPKPPPPPPEYKTPSTCEFPYGDEENANSDVLEESFNTESCRPDNDIKDLDTTCSPLTMTTITEIYTGCLNDTTSDLLFSSCEKSYPTVECLKCDLRKNADDTAVIVECFHCTEIPKSKLNLTEIAKDKKKKKKGKGCE